MQALSALTVVRSGAVPRALLMPPTEAQRRAHQKHEGERPKRSPIWLEPPLAKRLDRAVKRLKLPSRVAFVEYALAAMRLSSAEGK